MLVHQMDQTSSIGAVWPPQPATHQRLRGFYTGDVVRSEEDMIAQAGTFQDYRMRVSELDNISRLSLRFVTQMGNLATLHTMGVHIEGALPLANTEPGLCIAYAGYNEPDRQTTDTEMA